MIGLENYYKLLYDPEKQKTYDDIWVIMQYAPKGRPSNFHHVMALSPTRDLYRNYMTLKEQGQWDADMFDKMYVPRFVSNLVTDKCALSQLHLLVELASSGRNIALTCTCHYENMCHRSIIGGIIQGGFPEITVACERDYSRYWNLIKDM